MSARFYEGLSREDVEGCTLVVQAMANPAIFQAYPGEVRCPGDDLSDRVLGELQGPARVGSRGVLRPGATVAHMAYYLARHMGCDPVILVGQDLGFTDGQYYSAGAAIHRVWSGELNEFNTLEMMEWQRIVRSKSMLHRATDVLGRPIFTDEQMTTYLAQFERDFASDEREGLSTIDATEGGVVKRHTHAMALRDALAQCAPSGGRTVTIPPARPDAPGDGRLTARLREVRREALEVANLSRAAAEKLREMKGSVGKPGVVNRLIQEVYVLRDRATTQATGYSLAQFLNQTGAFNRAKADRAIELERWLTAEQRQERQIERDIKNVTWLADAAGEVGLMLDATVRAIRSGVKQTRPAQPRIDGAQGSNVETTVGGPVGDSAPTSGVARTDVKVRSRPRVVGYIQVDPEMNGLGVGRDLARPLAHGLNALALTVRRLAGCRELDGILIVAAEPACARSLLGPVPGSANLTVVQGDGELMRSRTRAVGAARVISAHAWRGGVGSMSVYDEAVCPRVAAAVAGSCEADAILVVGADWALVDPALCDAVVARYRENPEMNSLVFTQAPPGLSGCVVSSRLCKELGERQDEIGAIASIGGMLSYIPVAPLADPIAKPACVPVSPGVRDASLRFVPDSTGREAMARDVLGRDVRSTSGASVDRIVSHVESRRSESDPGVGPALVRLELTGRRPGRGLRAGWYGLSDDGIVPNEMEFDRACALIDGCTQLWPDTVVSFEGRGDPLLHPRWNEIVSRAVAAGFAGLHVRTDLGAKADVGALLAALRRARGAVLSVDLLATSRECYAALTGADEFDSVVENVRRVLAERETVGGLPSPWVVARMTRCDAVYGDVERFYDFWLMTAGAAVIDPLPRALDGERIAPLPVPENERARRACSELVVRADGSVADDPNSAWTGKPCSGRIASDGLRAMWARQVARHDDPRRGGSVAPGLGGVERVLRAG